MSIYTKALQEWRGTLTALLLTGTVAAATNMPAQAAPIRAGVSGGVVSGVVQANLTQLSGHVPGLVKQSAVLGLDRSEEPLDLSITLPLRNKAALDELIKGLYDPTDARYGHYLTSDQLAAQFGPTEAQYAAVVAWAQSKGFQITQTWGDRTKVDFTGSVAQANAAFGVTLKQFRASSGQLFFAPDTEVRVPSNIASLISGVLGLDNTVIAKPQLKVIGKADMSNADPASTAPPQGTGLGGGFTPSDLKTVYGLNGTTLNGAGQTIAMIEYGSGFNQKDARKYETMFGLPNVPIQAIQVGTAFTTYGGASTETMLDIDTQLAMAPGATKLLVYQGSGQTNNSLTNTIKRAQTDNTAKQVSISYGFGAEASATPSTFQNTLNTIFTLMVAQGQSVYISSGDSGSDSDAAGGGPTVDQLGAQPMVCCVGGTQLYVQNPGLDEHYMTETTWNVDGTPTGGAGGGGVSISYPIPSYQANAANFAAAGTNVSKTNRNIPDVCLVASQYTGVLIYSSVDPTLPGPGWYVIGGTSASAPLWAGYTALINQNSLLNGKSVMGFPNAVLYPLAYTANGLTSSYSSLFHDINDGSSNHTDAGAIYFTALTGFDDSTGLGSFQGLSLLSAISGSYPTSNVLPVREGRAQFHQATVRLASFGLPLPSRTKATL